MAWTFSIESYGLPLDVLPWFLVSVDNQVMILALIPSTHQNLGLNSSKLIVIRSSPQ